MHNTLPNLAQLSAEFAQTKQWQDRFRLIIQLAGQLPPLPEQFKQEQWLVAGCENRLWLTYQQDEQQRFWFQGDSESRIIKGLLTIILIAVNGKTATEINQFDFAALFEQLQLNSGLSESQQLGISRILAQLKALVNQK